MRMLSLPAFYIFVFACLRCGFSGLFDGSTQVVSLTADNFEEIVVKDTNQWAVDFYANWCGACQRFAPHWQTLATKYSKEKGVVMFGAIDCAVYTDFCSSRIDVSKFPELRVWHFPDHSASEEFQGYEIPEKPSESDIDNWLAAQLPKLHPISPPNLPPPVPAGDGSVAPPPQDIQDSLPAAVSVVYHLTDAEVGLLFSFRQGVFLQSEKKQINGEKKKVLKQEALTDLLRVLDYLSLEFPSKQACRDLAALASKVRGLVEAGDGYLEYTAWSQALDSQSLDGIPAAAGKNPGTFWRLCRTYTCGLWTLFHIISTRPPASAAKNASEQDPLAIVYTFVTRFFGCQDCVTHFSKMYDSCELDRCKVSPMDAKNASLWLWKAHNSVTARVASERKLKKPSPWPSESVCPECWDNGDAVNDEIYVYLRQHYWSSEWKSGGHGGEKSSFSAGLWFLIVLVVGGICVVIGCLLNGEDQGDARSVTSHRNSASTELIPPTGVSENPGA